MLHERLCCIFAAWLGVFRVAMVLALVAASAGVVAAEPETHAGGIRADRVLVLKDQRQLHLLSHGRIIRSYSISLGANPVGPKIFALDGRTPEGEYVIDSRKADSVFYRSLHISYPNADDRARAAKYGISPGGNIRIHGMPRRGSQISGDWTDGCIAVSNAAMREIWAAVEIPTPIEIRP